MDSASKKKAQKENKMPEKRAQIIYSGSVQGVGFRFTAERIANSLGLTGWVRNCPDGTVEIVCEGEEGDIHMFMNKIKKAMGHYSHSSKVKWEKATGEFGSFDIRFYC
ncbi:MAG: acylphosphatase [Candidatus Omnitrophota bacterium]|nr:MAG: acylphosphatase [Candidatus Omnitrophota bacterium]